MFVFPGGVKMKAIRQKSQFNRKRKISLFSILVLIFFSLSFASTGVCADVKAPKMVKIMTYGLGSTAYVMYGFLGEAMMNKFGARLRAIPAGNDIARMIPVRSGQAQFLGQGGDIYYASEGLDRYADMSWGPQPMRVAWMARLPGLAAIVRGDSGIKTCADLKGKRIPWIPGSVFNLFHEGWLAFANLTWDDVSKVQVAGFGAMLRALIDGKIDVAVAAITVPPAYELEASPHGIGFVPIPASDKAGWQRLNKIVPYLSPYNATFGAGISEEKPVACASYAYPGTACYASLKDDVAYFMTKAIHECHGEMAEKSKAMKRFWTLDQCLELYPSSKGYVFHPGSVRYLKEIGAWKSGWDELQAKRIERQGKLLKLWGKTLDEAEAQKIKAKNFPEFWLKKHDSEFGNLPE
jgi:uncharacterized protein